jgi:hypothetical protein
MNMSCCGGNRTREFAIGASAPSTTGYPMPPTPASVAVFRYEGHGSLTVIGPTTGRKYWFEKNGAELAIDIRDRAAVAQVPRVREMRLA